MLSIQHTKNVALIRELALKIWPHTYGTILSSEQLQYMLDMMYSTEVLQQQLKDGHTFLICYKDHTPIGFAGYSNYELGVFKLHKLYLLPEQQGLGAGRFIMKYIMDDLWDLGATHLRLNVNRYNHTAKAFYDRMGFSVISEEDIDIGSGYFMNDYIMQIAV